MTVNFEIKGMLARLLATEDLVVEHKKVETACFNVKTRVLTLPHWERASDVVYDMLVSHEVSHALYTPNVDTTSFEVPPQFINVVEDARVEKLVKRRYLGLSKTFYNAYKELHEQDFFSLENEDVDSLNFADRVNLYFKVGNFIVIEFTPKELELVNEISEIETFEETVECAKKLYAFCKEDNFEINMQLDGETTSSGAISLQSQNEDEGEGEGEDGNSTPSTDNSDEGNSSFNTNFNPSENDSLNNFGSSSTTPTNSPGQIANNSEPEIKTLKSLQNSIEKLTTASYSENVYVELPRLNFDTVVIENNKIHSYIKSYYMSYNENVFENSDNMYTQFKKEAQKEVNYLVKEFECKKAADSYSRSMDSKTGILDCTKLHTYKYNEDLFKKITTTADGKNHGLIFVLDWSGSMANCIVDTIKQLFNLIWFCKKVSIPFDVYAFTNEWRYHEYYITKCPPLTHYIEREGLLSVNKLFGMMNFLTSDVSGKELETQMKNIWRLAYSFRYSCSYTYPSSLALSGTPLNESMIALHSIIPNFQKKNKLQKVQCVVLTDGESSPIPYHVNIEKTPNHSYIGNKRIDLYTTFLRDRKLGTTYKLSTRPSAFTDTLIKNLRDNFKDVNFIGMRLMEGREAGTFIDNYCGNSGELHDKAVNDWKKDKSFFTNMSAYNGYFGISLSSLSQDSEFEVSENATKNQIKNAFAKSLKVKKLNKKILGEFIELIV